MPTASPLLEDAGEDDAEETQDTTDDPEDSARSLDDIIDAYARDNPEKSTTRMR